MISSSSNNKACSSLKWLQKKQVIAKKTEGGARPPWIRLCNYNENIQPSPGVCSKEKIIKDKDDTAWKVSKYGVFFGPNTGKYGPQKTPYLDTFHTVWLCKDSH